MRIVHILNHTGRFNGHVHAAVDLACAQAQSGHAVAICSAGGDFDALLAAHGVVTCQIAPGRGLGSMCKALMTLRRFLHDWKPDVVHAHMVTSAILAFPLCLLARRPLVTSVHNAFERSALLMGLGKRVIAVSAVVGKSLQKRGIPAWRLRVILNGTIGSARRVLPCPRPLDLHHPALLFVGGLHPRKGVVDLLNAFERVSEIRHDAHLYIVGEGPCRAEYESLANTLNCRDKISFCGGRDDPRDYLLAADIFVLPSHSDPAPLVISEAREAGCAVVATNVDGIPEMLENGEAGILVPPRAPEWLAQAILRLMSNEQVLAIWRAKSQINLDRLSVRRVAEQTLDVYAECLAHQADSQSSLRRIPRAAGKAVSSARPPN